MDLGWNLVLIPIVVFGCNKGSHIKRCSLVILITLSHLKATWIHIFDSLGNQLAWKSLGIKWAHFWHDQIKNWWRGTISNLTLPLWREDQICFSVRLKRTLIELRRSIVIRYNIVVRTVDRFDFWWLGRFNLHCLYNYFFRSESAYRNRLHPISIWVEISWTW